MRQQKFKFFAYVGSDLCASVGLRSFQMFIVWYYLKQLHNEHALAKALLFTWSIDTVLLPLAGILADAVKKRKVILMTQAFSLVSIGAFVSYFLLEANSSLNVLFALVCFGLLTAAFTLMSPLEAAILPALFSEQTLVSKAFRTKEALATINIAFGPALSSFLISVFGGPAALLVSVLFYAIGTSIGFWLYSHLTDKNLDVESALDFLKVYRQLCAGLLRAVKIPEERVIGLTSLTVNLVLIPFVFLLLPQKLVSAGYGMLQVAAAEISLGLSSAAAALYLVSFIQSRIGGHKTAVAGLSLISLGIASSSFTSNAILLCLAVASTGAGICVFNVTVITARSLAVPNGFKSAMESCLLFLCTAAVPLGLFICNVSANVISSNGLIRIGSIGLFASILVLNFSPSMKEFLGSENLTDYYLRMYGGMFSDVRR